MADPLSVVGAVGSLAGIIDILARSIRTIRELQDEWKNADFNVFSLISQLTALKAALAGIQEWKNNELVDSHHQLVMDLEFLVNFCGILVEKVDAEVSKLQINRDGALDKSSKTRIVFWNNMDDLSKMIERQTNALTLLLSVCHR
jgi:hypothetical protein